MKMTQETLRAKEMEIHRNYRGQYSELYSKGLSNREEIDEFIRIKEKEEAEKRELYKEFYEGFEVGDGVTYHMYSDAHACTIIKRTAKTITLQQDKATLSPDFKPDFIIGGFAAHCTNQEEQTYEYERNENGSIYIARWSDKYNGWFCDGKRITAGRHEFYDYNF